MLVHEDEGSVLVHSLGSALGRIDKHSPVLLLLPVRLVNVTKNMQFGLHFVDPLSEVFASHMRARFSNI